MIAQTFSTARVFFRECYRPLKLRGKSDHASRLHEVTLNNFARYLKREALLEDLESDTMACFLAWMSERGRQAITVNDSRNRLMALARFAKKRNLIAVEPEVEPLIEPERAPRAWLDADLEKLIAACAALRGTIGGLPASLWWVALHIVLLFTGERITAMLSLRWDQVDLDGGWMMLTAEQRKGKRRDKEWRLPGSCIDLLRQMKALSASQLVFATETSLCTIYNRYNKILISAGLPHDRQSKFHRMRKSTASHCAAAGGNATELLDHSSARVTKKYLDKRIVGEQSAVDLLKVPKNAVLFCNRSKPANPKSVPNQNADKDGERKESPHDPGRKRRKPPGRPVDGPKR